MLQRVAGPEVNSAQIMPWWQQSLIFFEYQFGDGMSNWIFGQCTQLRHMFGMRGKYYPLHVLLYKCVDTFECVSAEGWKLKLVECYESHFIKCQSPGNQYMGIPTALVRTILIRLNHHHPNHRSSAITSHIVALWNVLADYTMNYPARRDFCIIIGHMSVWHS